MIFLVLKKILRSLSRFKVTLPRSLKRSKIISKIHNLFEDPRSFQKSVLFTFVSNLARCRSGSRLRSRYRSRYASDLTHLVRYLVLDLALDLVLDQELDVQRTEKRFLLFDITISMHFFVDLCKFNRCNGLPTSSKPRTK